MSGLSQVRLVRLQFHPDDLVFIISSLDARAKQLRFMADNYYNHGDVSGYDGCQREAFRNEEIARAIALASSPEMPL